MSLGRNTGFETSSVARDHATQSADARGSASAGATNRQRLLPSRGRRRGDGTFWTMNVDVTDGTEVGPTEVDVPVTPFAQANCRWPAAWSV